MLKKHCERIAAIILKLDAILTEEDVKEYCRENIACHKVPEYVDFVEEFPMTASGKVQKFELREAAVERHNLIETADTM